VAPFVGVAALPVVSGKGVLAGFPRVTAY